MYNAYPTLVTQKTCMKNPPLTLTRLRDDPEPLLTTLKPLLTTLSLSGSQLPGQHVVQRPQESTVHSKQELLTRYNVVLTTNSLINGQDRKMPGAAEAAMIED